MLRFIYMFFVGLFVAIFLGTGIAAFYPSPKAPTEPTWFSRVEKTQITAAESQQEQEFNRQMTAFQKDVNVYNRNVSMIALGFAVLILVISLTMSVSLGVVANGLLLGGIFTLLYGIGRGMATDNNQYRFAVAALGLAVTLVLGTMKFAEKHPSLTKTNP